MRFPSKLFATTLIAVMCVWAAAAAADPITHVSVDTVFTL